MSTWAQSPSHIQYIFFVLVILVFIFLINLVLIICCCKNGLKCQFLFRFWGIVHFYLCQQYKQGYIVAVCIILSWLNIGYFASCQKKTTSSVPVVDGAIAHAQGPLCRNDIILMSRSSSSVPKTSPAPLENTHSPTAPTGEDTAGGLVNIGRNRTHFRVQLGWVFFSRMLDGYRAWRGTGCSGSLFEGVLPGRGEGVGFHCLVQEFGSAWFSFQAAGRASIWTCIITNIIHRHLSSRSW